MMLQLYPLIILFNGNSCSTLSNVANHYNLVLYGNIFNLFMNRLICVSNERDLCCIQTHLRSTSGWCQVDETLDSLIISS